MKVWIVSVPNDLDAEFRKVISMVNGGKYHKGDLKKAHMEAIKDFIRKKNQEF